MKFALEKKLEKEIKIYEKIKSLILQKSNKQIITLIILIQKKNILMDKAIKIMIWVNVKMFNFLIIKMN